jgi:hypothetical protein
VLQPSDIQISNVLVLAVHCKLINFVFQIFPIFIPEMPAGSSNTPKVLRKLVNREKGYLNNTLTCNAYLQVENETVSRNM